MDPASLRPAMSTANTRTGEAFQSRGVARSARKRRARFEEAVAGFWGVSELRGEGAEAGEPGGGATGLEWEGVEYLPCEVETERSQSQPQSKEIWRQRTWYPGQAPANQPEQ